jgi:Domain of unknown function (DUF4105)
MSDRNAVLFLRRSLQAITLLVLTAAIVVALVPRVRTPRHDRAWAPDMDRLPLARPSGSLVTIENVRHARYRSPTDFEVDWEERTVDPEQLASVWVMVEPFREHPSLGHTILSFGFADGRYLAFSAEARKEPGEEYGVVSGMLGKFELMDVVADERDVFGLRANARGDDVYLYPLRLDAGERRRVFEAALQRLREREQSPVFYHSLSNNCTTSLVDLLRAGRGDVLPGWHWSYWLPASFDRLLVERGLVEGATSVEEARARFRINPRAKGADTAADFSHRIRVVSLR